MSKYGLIGKNISYSLSPKLHNLIAFKSGYSINYEIIDIEEEQLSFYIDLLKQGIYQGFNITIPYKETIIKYLDKLTTQAEDIGAVNTVFLNKEGLVVGDNTDYYGFLKFLENNNILKKEIKEAYILGSGGSAKTVYHVLTNKNIKCIIVSRNKRHVKGFSNVISYEDLEKIKHLELLINCTPIGTHPKGGMPIKFMNQVIETIIDLTYNPLRTDLMRLSMNSFNGLEMLIYQALESQKIMRKSVSFKVNDDEKTIKFIKEALLDEFNR